MTRNPDSKNCGNTQLGDDLRMKRKAFSTVWNVLFFRRSVALLR